MLLSGVRMSLIWTIQKECFELSKFKDYKSLGSHLLFMNHNSGDIEDWEGVPQRKFTLKPAIIMWQYWLGNAKLKKAFRLILNAFKKLLQNLKKNDLMEFSTD